MNFKNFTEEVCKEIAQTFGNDWQVDVKEVRKNNGVVLHALQILEPGKNVIPNIYLDACYSAYRDGMGIPEIVAKILDVYHSETSLHIDIDFFRDFEQVKDRICCHLIGKNSNEALLAEIPLVDYLDLAICFHYAYQDNTLGEGTILLYNSHLEMWGVSRDEVYQYALANTPRLYPHQCYTMGNILDETMGADASEYEDIYDMTMLVLTNNIRCRGAVCICYPGVLEQLGKKYGSLYIAPSSIHEMILFMADNTLEPEQLKEIISKTNSTKVLSEEVLSNSLYYYDAAAEKISIL